MKVVGRFELHRLERTDPSMCGTLRALHAELEAACWRDEADARAAFPEAAFEGHCLMLALDETRCVVVAVNYPQEIAVIEYAGLCSKRPTNTPNPGRGRP